MATKIVGDFITVTTPALADEHLISQSAVTYNETNQQIHDTAFLLTAKTTPIDADTMPLNDTAAANVGKKVTWANIKATLKTYFDGLYAVIITAANFGDFITSLTGKTTPVDADGIILSDSAASGDSKKVTWANIKATLKTYFDGLYTSITGQLLSTDIQISINSGDTSEAAAHGITGTIKGVSCYAEITSGTFDTGVPSGSDNVSRVTWDDTNITIFRDASATTRTFQVTIFYKA
jgi:hypothetical protein